jgi:hypothetical protein
MADNQKRSCQRLTTTNSLSPSIIFAATNIDSSSSPSYFLALTRFSTQCCRSREGPGGYGPHRFWQNSYYLLPPGFSDLPTALLTAPRRKFVHIPAFYLHLYLQGVKKDSRKNNGVDKSCKKYFFFQHF